ncbi:toxin HicA, partial [Escherichia coli]
LREAGFTPTQGKGDHEKWRNGTTWTIITQTTECSPKVVKDALDAIERSKQQ